MVPGIAALLMLLPSCATYDPTLLDLGKGGDPLVGTEGVAIRWGRQLERCEHA